MLNQNVSFLHERFYCSGNAPESYAILTELTIQNFIRKHGRYRGGGGRGHLGFVDQELGILDKIRDGLWTV